MEHGVGAQRFQKAFTLIELMVVISIIVLLMAILLPSLRQARQAAQVTQCLSQQRQLMQMIFGYTVDWQGYIPPHMAEGPTFSSHVAWMTRMVRQRYLVQLNLTPQKTLAVRVNDIRLCPSMDADPINSPNTPDAGFSHYMMAMEVTGYWNAEEWLWGRTPLKLDAVEKPTQTMATSDAFYDVAARLIYSNTAGLGEDLVPAYRCRPGMAGDGPITNAHWRHSGDSTVFSFLDGHAAKRRWDESDPFSVPFLPYLCGGFGKLLGPLRGKNYDG